MVRVGTLFELYNTITMEVNELNAVIGIAVGVLIGIGLTTVVRFAYSKLRLHIIEELNVDYLRKQLDAKNNLLERFKRENDNLHTELIQLRNEKEKVGRNEHI